MHAQSASPPDRLGINICAVVIAFNPDLSLLDRLDAIRSQVRQVILVDNGSSEEIQPILQHASQDSQIEVLANAENVGVAAALNQGLSKARDEGFEWVLTLDQDSEPSQGMVEELWAAYGTVAIPERIAIIAPQVIDADIGRRAPFLSKGLGPFYRRLECSHTYLDKVTTVITSGALLLMAAFEAIGGFQEDFFIDYVDTEFCLRAQSLGYRIVVACCGELYHRPGDRRRTTFGPLSLYPTFHTPARWYSISSNRIPMLRKYAPRFPLWLTYDLVASLFTIFRMLLTEDQKLAKLRAIVQGTADGLRCRMGKPPTPVPSESTSK